MRRLVPPLVLLAGLACGDDPAASIDGGVDAGASRPDTGAPSLPDSGPDPFPAPTITRVSPPTGPETGRTRVTIRGTSFIEPVTVRFGGIEATNVVLLDEVSVAATTPPGARGAVMVAVSTPGGEALLPEGFTYHRDLRVLSVSPARVPEEGGVAIELVGRGFDEHTLIMFDRIPLRGSVFVDAEHIRGFVPALRPGRPEIRVLHREAEDRRSDLLTVFATPEIQQLEPGYGAAGALQSIELAGSGFEDATALEAGGLWAQSLSVHDGSRASAVLPALAEGAHAIEISNPDARDRLEGGYLAVDLLRADLRVVGALPPQAPLVTGGELRIVGAGFKPGMGVAIDGVSANIVGVDATSALVRLPQGLSPGPADVVVTVETETATAAQAVQLFVPIQIDSISPDRGPASGGTEVELRGRGFVQGMEVRIADVPLADVVVQSDGTLRGRTVAGAHGPHDVVARHGRVTAALAGGFSFDEPFEVIRLDPIEGSIAGNTHVSVFGRGFGGAAGVAFGGVDGLSPAVENGSLITARTQPASTGSVDVVVRAAAGEETLAAGFSFYDPRLLTGGAWGGPIEGSVNVAVQTFDGTPMAGMVVQLGFDADLRYTAITDDNGLATISSPEIRGAQTVTAGAPGIEFVTFQEIDARNISMFASPYPRSMPPDAPVPPCPEGGEAPVVKGRIFRFKSALDEQTAPGFVPIARITYTDATVFAPNPPTPPEQVDFVFGDGEEYEIVVMRAGTVAVFAVMGDFNPDTQAFIPRRMGIRRNVPAAPGVTVEGMDISLDIELDQTVQIRLDDPPRQTPGPSINAVFPFLNLESEGVIPFTPAVVGSGAVYLTQMPSVAESEFFYMGGSFTAGANGALRAPFSLSLLESDQAFESGIDLGPFLQMPQNASPKPSEILRSGTVRWDQAGVTPDITMISVVDVAVVGGCCCLDGNANGTCEDAEFQQCGSMPQQYNRWSVFAQGGLASYSLPRMPSGVAAFQTPAIHTWLAEQAIAPRFRFEEFIYNQFSPYFWRSWSLWSSQFLVKEETD